MAPEHAAQSLALTESATRLLKASTLGKAIDDQDLQNLRAAADAEDHNLPPEELACHVLLREVRKRRQVMMAAAESAARESSASGHPDPSTNR
jgi:hypothetical protein